MPTVSGNLLFDRNRTGSATSLPGIVGVPIALQNTSNWLSLVVLTGAGGAYSFTNVPAGSYQIVEAYGTAATSTTRRL